MRQSVLEAIQSGAWDYEPDEASADDFESTAAPPGSDEKLRILAQRVSHGFPLWHPLDRRTYDHPLESNGTRH